MDGHAIWVDKCTKNIYEINEWSVERLHRQIFHSISGWHTNLQQDKGGTLKTFDISDGKVETREIVDKSEEEFFYEDITHIFGFRDLFKWIEDRSKKCKSNQRMAITEHHIWGKNFSWVSEFL